MRQFSIIIPTLNEAENVVPLLQHISKVSKSNKLKPQVIFVDDGSRDGTRQHIDNYSGELEVLLLKHDPDRGLAGAVLAGAEVALHQLIIVMDADLSHPPAAIPALLAPLQKGTHDMVIGSRYVAGGAIPDWPKSRLIASRLASIPARLLTSVKDPLAGFFAVRRGLLISIDPQIAGFKIGLEIVAAATGCRVLEVPIVFQDRQRGASKANLSVLVQYLEQLWRLFRKNHCPENIGLILGFTLVAAFLDCFFFHLLTSRDYALETSHVVSFMLAMHICYPALLFKEKRRYEPHRLSEYLSFLTIILLALFVRGGLLALTSTPPEHGTASFPFILAGTTVLTWLMAIVICRTEMLNLRQPGDFRRLGLLLIAYTILLRLSYLGGTELIQEEAYYWNYAQHMAPGYLDHPPVVALLIKLGTLLFGNNEFGVRIGAFSCWFLTATFIYKLTKEIFSPNTAFRVLLLLAVLPIFFGVALVITPDAPLVTCWAGALYFFYKALIQDSSKSWYGAGICLGIGLASKYTIVFLGPSIFLYMLIDTSARKWFFKPQPYVAALLAISIFSPVIWWNYQNEWISFLFQSQQRIQAKFKFSTFELLGSILVLLTPTGLLAVWGAMSPRLDSLKLCRSSNNSTNNRSYLFCLTMAVVPLSIFVIFSLTRQIKLNWTGPVWLAVLPFMAHSMTQYTSWMQEKVARMWPKTLVILVMSYGVILHYFAIGLPGIPFTSNDFLFGWDDLARQVEKQVDQISEKDGVRPLVVGMDGYRIPSGLAFYRQKLHQNDKNRPLPEETTGNHLFGLNDLMYKYWFPPSKAVNRNLLLISQEEAQLRSSLFNHHYNALDKVHEITILKQGKEAGRYYYRLLKWYSPDKQGTISSHPPSKQQKPADEAI